MASAARLNPGVMRKLGKSKSKVSLGAPARASISGLPPRPLTRAPAHSARPQASVPSSSSPRQRSPAPSSPPQQGVALTMVRPSRKRKERFDGQPEGRSGSESVFRDLSFALHSAESFGTSADSSFVDNIPESELYEETVHQAAQLLLLVNAQRGRLAKSQQQLASMQDKLQMTEANWKESVASMELQRKQELAAEAERYGKLEEKCADLEKQLRSRDSVIEVYEAKITSLSSWADEERKKLEEEKHELFEDRAELERKIIDAYRGSEEYSGDMGSIFYQGYDLCKSEVGKDYPEVDLRRFNRRKAFFRAYFPNEDPGSSSEEEDEARATDERIDGPATGQPPTDSPTATPGD